MKTTTRLLPFLLAFTLSAAEPPKLDGTWEVVSFSGLGPRHIYLAKPGQSQITTLDVNKCSDSRILIEKGQLTWRFVPPPDTTAKGGIVCVLGISGFSMTGLNEETNPPPAHLVQAHSFTLPTASSNQIDLTIRGSLGPEGERTSIMKGIYELKDDTLRLCAAHTEATRPTKFEVSSSDTDKFMFVLKRKKP